MICIDKEMRVLKPKSVGLVDPKKMTSAINVGETARSGQCVESGARWTVGSNRTLAESAICTS
jgi:hypothetical protein